MEIVSIIQHSPRSQSNDVLVKFDTGKTLITGAADVLNFERFRGFVRRMFHQEILMPEGCSWPDHVRSIYERCKLENANNRS